ncbi:MAG: SDR family oxidoreductase [Bacteroidota bacterium]
MKILLTGSTGYIGRRLLPILVQEGHYVTCAVRDRRRFDWEDFDDHFLSHVEVVEADFSDADTLTVLPTDFDVAYYLIHSLTQSGGNFEETEQQTAQNFAHYLKETECQHLIYLGGIANDTNLSRHLSSRKSVEALLKSSGVPTTVLRAAIIIGSGSASFEIIRDLVEKLPIMVAPKWLSSQCQPIGIRNVIDYLSKLPLNQKSFDKTYDIGGPDVLTYRQMLYQYAEVRNLKRIIITVPVLTPKLSSLWLYFVTSTAYMLARNLVDSMRNDVVVEHKGIHEILPLTLSSYKEALKNAFSKINQKNVISSWKDSISNAGLDQNFLDYIEVPEYGCFHDIRQIKFERNEKEVLENVWQIGGVRGWYFGNFLWKIRGFLDQLVGGVGLRRGRRDAADLKAGDSLDFWRVLKADKEKKQLLLYAEMKLPGEAWLEFKLKQKADQKMLFQKATFRPLGLWGRLYWYLVLPFHFIIFPMMAKNIVRYK